MSGGLLTVALIAAGVFVVAALWVALTRHISSDDDPFALPVVWMRPSNSRIAHLFRVAELGDELADVEPLAHCGRWPVAELVPGPLVPDDEAELLCVPCARAVEHMEHRHQ